MATRRAIRNINWAALTERLPESERNAFAAFKAKSDQYLKRVQENPEEQPKIDWAYYKKSIGVAGLVDKFQKEYEALKIPYPQDKYTSQIEAQEKEVLSHIQKFISESNQRIAENEKQIKKLQSLIKYSNMTMEDFRDAHPDIAMDPINRPTIFPHTEDVQPNGEEEEEKSAH